MMDGQLDEVVLSTLFKQKIRPYLNMQASARAETVAEERPRIIFVGGQPGAGKSRAITLTKADLGAGLVEIIGDDFRRYHPDYSRLMREDPFAMPGHTAQASGRWVGMSADYCRQEGYSVVLETTLRQAKVVAGTMTEFKNSGYTTELRVVSVPLEMSRLGTVSRYAGQIIDYGSGRWTPSAAHDEAARAIPETIAELIESGLVDRILLVSRAGDILYEAERSENGSGIDTGEVLGVLDKARTASEMSVNEAVAWMDSAREALDILAGQKDVDDDLRATVHRIITEDAPAIAAVAYPDEEERQQQLAGLKEIP